MLNRKNKLRTYTLSAGTKLKYEKNPLRDKVKKLLSAIIVLGLVYYFLAGNRGLIRLVQMKTEKHRLMKEVAKIEEDNGRSIEDIRSLKYDLRSIERIAREDLGLVKKGEVVFRFVNINPETGREK